MFDDEIQGIIEEPFVGGFSELIDFVLKEYHVFNGAHRGINIKFSLVNDEENMARIDKIDDLDENWARYSYKHHSGLLCPLTLQYFGKQPDYFFIKPQKIPFELEFQLVE